MARTQNPQLSSRKQPKQARSAELIAAILEGAAQVLAKEGAHRFTTARVAEKAGVSVGSIYQYFPNKAAILFRLQSDEWRQTSELLSRTLQDLRKPPLERLRTLVHVFVQSECDEAAMRLALNDAAPFYRNAAETKEARASGRRVIQAFVKELLPNAPKKTHALVGNLIGMTLSALGKQFSESSQSRSETKLYANAMADMFCAYLKSFES